MEYLTYRQTTYISVDSAQYGLFSAKVGKGGLNITYYIIHSVLHISVVLFYLVQYMLVSFKHYTSLMGYGSCFYPLCCQIFYLLRMLSAYNVCCIFSNDLQKTNHGSYDQTAPKRAF